MFRDKCIMISGGTGSWGNELTKQLLEKDPKRIIIFSRGELAQVNMQRKFNDPRLKFVIGDVRDADAVDRLFSIEEVDYVYHMAALKHVPVCENQPQEAIKTNITGTINLINSAIKYKVKKFIDVSTDKSVEPSNTYGLTKAVGERLSIQANCLGATTSFVCVRGGNVLGTNGSVVPLFIKQIKDNNAVTITNGRMTRFFLTLPEAISLLFQATETSVGGEIYVMNMPAFFIDDLADTLIAHYGDKNTKKVIIGSREGEKVDEVLISEYEAIRSFVFNKDYYIIKPDLSIDKDFSYVGNNKFNFGKFSSSNDVKSKEFLKELLNRGGFLS